MITDFPIFDTLIRSGDIRDQIPKLSKIAKNYPIYHPCLDFDLFRSRDVIGHVSIRFPIWHFLLVVN